MNDKNELQVLCALFSLSRGNQPIHSTNLALAARLSPTQTAAALVVLGQVGLVDRSRLRLTLSGLAVAARHAAAPDAAVAAVARRDELAARALCHGLSRRGAAATADLH